MLTNTWKIYTSACCSPCNLCLFCMSTSTYVNLEVTVWLKLEFLLLSFPLKFLAPWRAPIWAGALPSLIWSLNVLGPNYPFCYRYKTKWKSAGDMPNQPLDMQVKNMAVFSDVQGWSHLACLTVILTYQKFIHCMLIYFCLLRWCASYGKTCFII